MSFSMFRTGAIAGAIALAPTLSPAQEVFGTIDASLDGAERTWFLTSQGGESQSFGLIIDIANLQSFGLWGQSSTESVQSLDDTLLLSFDVMSVGGQLMPLNVSLTYLEDGWNSGWLANDPEKIDFSLTALEAGEDAITVEGRFAATAYLGAPLVEGEVDTSKSMQMTGSFSATLPASRIEEN